MSFGGPDIRGIVEAIRRCRIVASVIELNEFCADLRTSNGLIRLGKRENGDDENGSNGKSVD
jgi:hypothetical protein